MGRRERPIFSSINMEWKSREIETVQNGKNSKKKTNLKRTKTNLKSGNLQFAYYIKKRSDGMAIASSLATLIKYSDHGRRCHLEMASHLLAPRIQEPKHDNHKMLTSNGSRHTLTLNTKMHVDPSADSSQDHRSALGNNKTLKKSKPKQ